MKSRSSKYSALFTIVACLGSLGAGLALGQNAGAVKPAAPPPDKHVGVSVVKLGALSEENLKRQIGLSGYIMQLREITLAPGGAIAKHSHAKRPGLVWTVDGSWIEGRPNGEKEYPASKLEAILEDENTEHWFFNRGDKPAKVVVCDIVPKS